MDTVIEKFFFKNPVPMWIYDLETYRFMDVNHAAIQAYGYDRDAFLSMNLFDIRPESETARLREDLAAVRPELQHSGTWKHRLKDGRLIDVEVTSHTLTYEGRDAALVMAVDVTDRTKVRADLESALQAERRTRQELEKTNRRLSFLLQANTTLAESPDYEGRLRALAQSMVPEVADWCAVDIAQADGTLKRLAVVHKDPAKVRFAYELAERYPADPASDSGAYGVLRSRTTQFVPEITDELLVASARDEGMLSIVRSLGFRSAMIVPLVTRGLALGVISLVTAESDRRFSVEDVSLIEDLARRAAMLIDNARLLEQATRLNAELEKRVAERTAQLTVSNKELEAFSYSVSHDLRAPLRHLAGFTELLRKHVKDLIDDKARHYLDSITAASRQMGQLIDDLLAFSRIGRASFESSAVETSALVQQVISESAVDHRQRIIDWRIDSLPAVRGDAGMLKLAFQNLIDNALKFTRPRDRAVIEVNCREEADRHVFTVRDNGVGFDPRYADKLFEVFQRLHSRNEFEGTGIGLANVRRIVERHGGRIWAHGAPGEGASFSFSLPRVTDGRPGAVPSGPPSSAS